MYKYLVLKDGEPPRYTRKFDPDTIELGMTVIDLYQDVYLVFGKDWLDVVTP